MRTLLLTPILLLALTGCLSTTAPATHAFAWFPQGVCPDGVRVEASGFNLGPVRTDSGPVEMQANTFLVPLQASPTTYEEGYATPPWRWRGAAKAWPQSPGSGIYRFTCLPYGLPPLDLSLAWQNGDTVALLILEDRNAPSGIRVGVRYW